MTFKTQSQTVRGEFQLFSSVRTSFPRHPCPSPSSLALRFDLGEPVPAYGWNLKLRTWPLVVTENHKAFVVRTGFQLRRHGHISLWIAAFWGLHGGPLRVRGPGCYSLTDPAWRGGSLSHPPPSMWGCSAEHGPGEFHTIIDKRLSLCGYTSCARSH